MSDGHWLWESDEGRMEITQIGPRFVTITLVGRAGNGAVPDLEEALSKLAPVEGVALFFDAFELSSFSNEFRARATDHILRNRKTIGKIAVLSGSALIAMAVSATNLALGGIVDSHRDATSFRMAQLEVARDQGLDPTELAG